MPLAPSCAVRGCGITRVVAPLTAPTACVPWLHKPPHVARFTGVNRETEERGRQGRRVSEPRAAENGRRDEEEERTHAATGRVQREGGKMANPVMEWKQVSPWVVAAKEVEPVKVDVSLISGLMLDRHYPPRSRQLPWRQAR